HLQNKWVLKLQDPGFGTRRYSDDAYAEGETVSKERALQELSRHCVPETDFEEFFSDMGVKEQYDAQEVLLWLGY
ncbi:hypothetical protein, partial [Salmonella enterica]|uniref:hypothetical protein n=1 Tax=Salmonella enterica TaxID=28901 RepID=UPI0039062453